MIFVFDRTILIFTFKKYLQLLAQQTEHKRQQQLQSYKQEKIKISSDGNSDNDFINVIFSYKDKNKIFIQINQNEDVSILIQKYIKKSCDMEEKIFIFNAQKLNPSLTCKEAGLINLSNVFVYDKKDI